MDCAWNSSCTTRIFDFRLVSVRLTNFVGLVAVDVWSGMTPCEIAVRLGDLADFPRVAQGGLDEAGSRRRGVLRLDNGPSRSFLLGVCWFLALAEQLVSHSTMAASEGEANGGSAVK